MSILDGTPAYRNRVIRQDTVPANTIKPCPMNWRTHSPEQRATLKGLLHELGFASSTLVRQCDDGTLELIDGHLRTDLMGEQLIPVTVTDLSEDEALKLLTLYDPIKSKAGRDDDKLKELLAGLQATDPNVKAMLAKLSPSGEGVPKMPVEATPKPEAVLLMGPLRAFISGQTFEKWKADLLSITGPDEEAIKREVMRRVGLHG